jgi:tol-pal system protein YbgF
MVKIMGFGMRRVMWMMLAVALMPWGVQAQDAYLEDKVRRLERDLSILQRQVYRGGGSRGRFSQGGDARVEKVTVTPDVANLEARIAQAEEQIRNFQGQIEQMQFQVRSMKSANEQQAKMVEEKLMSMDQQLQEATASAGNNRTMMSPAMPGANDAGQSMMPAPSSAAASAPMPDNERDHYNHAFMLLNQARFGEARAALQSFIERYPSSPLVGNAYYWLAETFYVERDYLQAANHFRKGYEILPEGPKAPDNLLKLGMSLAVLGKNTEACVVYDQIMTTFPNAGSAITQKVEHERNQLNCKPL